ncbi:MAG TPA: bacteriohemerythrin [Candidatus Limiplasma sp.]|nr:bacteriohemerythrin [Candidatus Limiplasma sp.]
MTQYRYLMMDNEKHKKLEYEYRLLSENALECIWVFDIQAQRFTYMSPNVTELRGITVEEAMQESLADAVPQESYDTAVKNTRMMVERYLAGERRKEMLTTVKDMRIYTTDGKIKQIEVTVRLIQNEETGAFEMLGVSRDITERKRLEEQLTQALAGKNEMIARLEKSEKALKRLTAELNRKNKALGEIAVKDALTGIYNRYYFDRKVAEETDRCQRYVYPLSMILFDIDNFKTINDTWGHDIGDHVLKRMAAAAKKAVRRQDVLARWGGEEFVVLMPHTDLQAAVAAANKLCTRIEALGHPEIQIPVKASFGAAQYIRGESKESWFQRVDHAMFCAKDKGGNCVIGMGWTQAFPFVKVTMEWKKSWESGNAHIDSQHKRLVALMNKTMSAMQGRESTAPGAALETLLHNIRTHFDTEEALLQKVRYPQADTHAALHDALWARITALHRQLQSGETTAAAFFAVLLDELLIGHIQTEDFQFFPYLKRLS